MDPNQVEQMDEGNLGETVYEADSSEDGDDDEEDFSSLNIDLEDNLGQSEDDVIRPEIPDSPDLLVHRIYMFANLGKLQAVLKFGSDVNLTNTDGLTAYDLARRDEDGRAAMALLEEAGASPRPTCDKLSQQVKTESEDNLTVNQNYDAAKHGDPGTLRDVVSYLGASTDAGDTESKTALMIAVYNNDVVAASTLVYAGATVSPLILDTAIQWCDEDMVQTLLTSSELAAKEERHALYIHASVREMKEIKSSNACENNNTPSNEVNHQTTDGSGNIESQKAADNSGNCGINHLQDDCVDSPSILHQSDVGKTGDSELNPSDVANTDRCDGIEMPNFPDSTVTHPDNTDTNPDNTDTNPDNTDTHLDNTDTNPDNTDTNPDNTDTNPDNTDTNPHNTDTNPDNTDTNPDNTDTNPDNTDTHPNSPDIMPSRSDTTTDNPETNPLFESIANGDVVRLQYLLETQPDLNARDSHNRTLLHAALQARQLDMVKILLTAGADCNAEDSDGNTPLMLACDRGVREAVSLLVKHGADVTRANRRGETALTTAAARSDLTLLVYLSYLRLRFGHRTAISSAAKTALSSVVLISVLTALFSFIYITM